MQQNVGSDGAIWVSVKTWALPGERAASFIHSGKPGGYVAYFILRFARPAKRDSVVPPAQHMIEAGSAELARERAEQIAASGGGGKVLLQLFNEIGLVSTRSAQGVWSRS